MSALARLLLMVMLLVALVGCGQKRSAGRSSGGDKEVRHIDGNDDEKKVAPALTGKAKDKQEEALQVIVERLKGHISTRRGTLDEVYGVSFFNTGVAGSGLSVLKQLPNLDWLQVDSRNVSDTGLARIGECKKLKYLSLKWAQITDGGLAHLSGLDKLEELDLRSSRINGSGLTLLAKLPRLKKLHLGNSYSPVEEGDCRDDELKHLKDFSTLESLTLYSSKFSDKGLAHVAAVSSLRELDLASGSITDAGLAKLPDLKKLRVLKVYGAITDAGLKHVAAMPELEMLTYTTSQFGKVTDAGFAQLKKVRPKLKIEGVSDRKESKKDK